MKPATLLLITASLASASTSPQVGAADYEINGIVKKTLCALTCVTATAKTIPCKGENIAEALCGSIDEIKTKSDACVKECGIPQKILGTVLPCPTCFNLRAVAFLLVIEQSANSLFNVDFILQGAKTACKITVG